MWQPTSAEAATSGSTGGLMPIAGSRLADEGAVAVRSGTPGGQRAGAPEKARSSVAL